MSVPITIFLGNCLLIPRLFLVWQEAKIISVRIVKKKRPTMFSLAIQTQREIAIDLYWIFEARLKMLSVSKATQWILFLQVNICQKLFFLQNMGRTCYVQKLFWMSETISVHNMFSPGYSLEFSCIEFVIKWAICRHILD